MLRISDDAIFLLAWGMFISSYSPLEAAAGAGYHVEQGAYTTTSSHFSICSCLKAYTELTQTKRPCRSKHILLLTLPVHYKQKHTCISYHTYTIIIWYLTNHLEIEGSMRACACQWEWGCCDICRHLCKVQFFFCRGPAGRLK